MHTLQNDFLKISIHPKGAEMQSIQSQKTGTEYLWQGNKNFWQGRSPILFPIVGRLKNDQYIYKNKIYTLQKHGFLRENTKIKVIEKTKTKIIFRIENNSETLLQYPFAFILKIIFEIVEHKIFVSYELRNPSPTETMLFSIGGHPAFNCNLKGKKDGFEGCYFEFEKTENFKTRLVNPEGLIKNTTKNIGSPSKILRLHKNIFDNDALIFQNLRSRKVVFNNREGRILRFDFANFPYLAFWAPPAAPFVCIEPWYGIGDNEDSCGNFENKEGMQNLQPHENFKGQYMIEIA